MQYAALKGVFRNWHELNLNEFKTLYNFGGKPRVHFHKLDAHWRGIVSNRGTNTSPQWNPPSWKSVLHLTRFAEYLLTRNKLSMSSSLKIGILIVTYNGEPWLNNVLLR